MKTEEEIKKHIELIDDEIVERGRSINPDMLMIHSLEIQKCIFEFVLDGESVDKSDKKMTDEELQFNLKYDQLFPLAQKFVADTLHLDESELCDQFAHYVAFNWAKDCNRMSDDLDIR